MRRPYLLAALLGSAVALAALAAACGGTKVVTPSPTVIVVTPTPAPATGTGSRENPVPWGQALLLPAGWELSLTDVIGNAPGFRTSMGFDDFRPPSEGHRNIVVQARAKNVAAGNPARLPYGYTSISLVGSSMKLYDMAWPGPPPAMGDAILQGGTLEGDIPFADVPDDETGLMLVVQEGQDTFFFALE